MLRPTPQRPRNPELIRKLAVIYGIVMVNIGAYILFDKLAAPEIVFDKTFKMGAVCTLLGVFGLVYARGLKKRP